MIVYAVVYQNYEPAEVDSLWFTEDQAKQRIVELKDDLWRVGEWQIQGEAPSIQAEVGV